MGTRGVSYFSEKVLGLSLQCLLVLPTFYVLSLNTLTQQKTLIGTWKRSEIVRHLCLC